VESASILGTYFDAAPNPSTFIGTLLVVGFEYKMVNCDLNKWIKGGGPQSHIELYVVEGFEAS